ncbi:MAG: potassium/proton antiporter [Ignavibacteriales bacterium]|nr:potassium/proton antiporter [Ignavibacteriales bacterium]
MSLEYVLLVGSILILVSIAIAKLFDNLGVPTLLLFLGVGMLAGSEGPGGIYFDDAGLAQSIGIIALVFILFAGGLDTSWREVKPVFLQAASLATVGVLLTALAVGLFVHVVLGVSLLVGLLLGAVVSSTDAAAVFSVLRSKDVSLRGRTKPLLELESGSNDPMAVFLTVGIIHLLTTPGSTWISIATLFVIQMGLGAVLGLGLGNAMVFVLNRLKLAYDGIYSVFSMACAVLIYGTAVTIGGSGFLAVYVAGLVAGNSDFIQKRSLLRFFDGLAWLSQIAMFVALGLLVFPSRLATVMGAGLLVSGFLMFVARPASVFFTLLPAKLHWNEKAFVSWVGLRGAVPIILATFPLLAGLPDAEVIFNLVFFIVLTSALLQGWSIPFVARWLRVDAPLEQKRRYPIEFAPMEGVDTELVDLIIPYHSEAAGKSIIELGMPRDSLIVLISRGNDFIVPSGGTILREGDAILVLVNKDNLPAVREIIGKQKKSGAL